MKNNIKITDIAKKAGVSLSAVSFALNGRPGISDETRKKIFKIIDELGYTPDPEKLKKGGKAKQKEKSIMLLNCSRTEITKEIFPNTIFFSELLSALESKLSASGYFFWVKTVVIDDSFQNNIRNLFFGNSVKGIILVATDMLEDDVRVVKEIVPNLVVLDTCCDHLNANCIVMDNYLGGVLAAEHLCQSGHTQIGYIESRTRIYNFDMRKKGFFDELRRRNITVADRDIIPVLPSINGSFEKIKDELVKRSTPLPTAFFAENDYMAIGMLRAMQGKGIRVPDDVSIIGFDNIDMCKFVSPPITSIDVPKHKIAETSVTQLMKMFTDDSFVNIKQFVTVKLIERQSTKKM
ncbi:MAG: LacI family DNA-binding transcriptional regulator [Flexilinea sp.]|jgi:DNA-binding LacI/PurR family transcriptional regulator